ncbi:MAG: nitrous oxide reductase family maturation protein NosD [Deltaproteobacteria bacterium]|nr:nitrous oxide reductase family maturation protein NosD [Deltaproteobacteria bacterium]
MRQVLAAAFLLVCPALLGAVVEEPALVVGVDAPSVQETIDLAEDGARVLVPKGTWAGPVVVNKAITLQGDGGVIDGGRVGTVVRLEAPGARLLNLNIKSSGDDRGGPDSCVYVTPEAIGAAVVDSEITDCTFGIWVHEGREVRIEGNHVVGRPDLGHRSNRGNGIHLFDSTGLQVVGNRVEGARDGIYVSATEDSLIAENHTSDLRYGIHYMYSWRNTIRDNTASRNTAGIALMSSQHIVVQRNHSADNEAHGILFRDVQYSRIEANVVENNGEGLFFFSSLDNTIEGNRVAHNAIGARVWAGSERNVIRGNDFVGNKEQVFYVAATDQEWGDAEDGNYWSDYLGWDQDMDGRGDRAYRVDSTTAGLVHRYPAAVLLLSSPALELILRVQQMVPALAVPTIIDRAPRTSPRSVP